jgi:hypothetical protein
MRRLTKLLAGLVLAGLILGASGFVVLKMLGKHIEVREVEAGP